MLLLTSYLDGTAYFGLSMDRVPHERHHLNLEWNHRHPQDRTSRSHWDQHTAETFLGTTEEEAEEQEGGMYEMFFDFVQ